MKWVVFAALCAVLCGCGEKDPERDRKLAAFAMCKGILTKVSRDPDKADIPFVEPKVVFERYNFVWNRETHLTRMRNGFGLEIAVEAACDIDRESLRIDYLALGDQILIEGGKVKVR